MDALLTRLQIMLGDKYQMRALVERSQWAIIWLMIGVFLLTLLLYWHEDRKNKKIFAHKKVAESTKLQDLVFVSAIKRNFDAIGREKRKKKDYGEKATILVVSFSVLFGLFLTSQGQIAVGLTSPFALLWIFKKLTGLLITSKNEYVIRDLPDAIDQVKRSLTKYDDLKTVLYTASDYMEDPLKEVFKDLSKKMNTAIAEDVLDNFMREQNNLWLYNFAFCLLSYVKSAGKDELNRQLEELKEVLLKEGAQRNADRIERKMTVAVNYVLCAIAIIALIGNLIFMPSARVLFFSTPYGAAAFIIGIIMVIVSIFSNILIGSGKGGK